VLQASRVLDPEQKRFLSKACNHILGVYDPEDETSPFLITVDYQPLEPTKPFNYCPLCGIDLPEGLEKSLTRKASK
jgi:hypothetical protein